MATTFTIAIPTHDRCETVELAVRSALTQTREPAQVVVLCDGCTDGTVAALEAIGDPRLEVLDLPKLPGYAYDHRNRALERARGEAILWLGDDDLLLPDHLERLGALWDAGGADVVLTPAVEVREDDALLYRGHDWSVPHIREYEQRANTAVMGSVSIAVELARRAGGWDGACPRLGDWDLWRRALAAGARPRMTDEPTLLHFRATGREQPWADRVRQNRAWAARIADPVELAALRPRLRAARAAREGELLRESEEREAYALSLAEHLARREAEAAERDARIAALEDAVRERDAAYAEVRAELDRLRGGAATRPRRRLWRR